MSVYAIGDVQGCCDQAQALIARIQAESPQARLIFVGDLVNRGPRSLATLRTMQALGQRAQILLGNHDLHLLAVANGLRKAHRSDTLQEILDAPDREALLDWLRRQPLALFESDHLLVHAGVLPQWDVAQTLALAHEVETCLRGPDWIAFLREMYGNQPARWDDSLTGHDRLRCIVNALTRIRFCASDGTMEFDAYESSDQAPAGFQPWFSVAGRKTADTPVVFGHWSTLGLTLTPRLVGLDTGCVWGGKLSAVRLHDHALLQVDCPQQQRPGK